MKNRRSIVAALLVLLFLAPLAGAEGLQEKRYHLSMSSPTDWRAMSEGMLAETNAQVNHFTGRGFIAGYMLNESPTLVFPYMLVQFKPYSALPADAHPAGKLDEQGQLKILYALVSAFRQQGPLPDTIDTPQFIDRFGNKNALLTRLDDEYGRFDFTGSIPHEEGQTPIEYHTHGIFGKEGIAIVTVFTTDGFTGLTQVIQQDMRTIGFDEGYTMAELPEETAPPTPDEATADTPTEQPATPDATEPDATAEQPAEAEPVAEAEQDAVPAADETEPTAEPSDSTTGHADSGALIIILSLLGVVLVAAAFIAWFVAHRKAQARREQRRARRERMHGGQSTTQAPSQPRPASPTSEPKRESTGRRKHGTRRH